MAGPTLYGTPLSHFTRKIRILLAELSVEHELVYAPGVLGARAAVYGDNPLLRVPALVVGDELVIESDHIARYVVAKYDPDDRLGVRSERVADLNRLAVTSGIMNNEVVLILAKRGGLADLGASSYFAKLIAAIESGLAWLDARTDVDDPTFDYRDIATICMWDHVAHYKLVALEPYRRLASRVARFADHSSVARTAPAVSLADAAARGWRPE